MEHSDIPSHSEETTPVSYPHAPSSATLRLQEKLIAQIQSQGPLSFSTYMESALYDEEFGYYSAANHLRVGREGDFYTSVSVGPIFGRLLAHRLFHFWQAQNPPEPIRLIEIGAHDGTLAHDILKEAASLSPDFLASIDSWLVETSPVLRSQQKAKAPQSHSVAALSDIPASDIPTVVLSNELFDALPVDLYQLTENGWCEKRISLDESDKLTWLLADETSSLLPDSIDQSEFRLGMEIEIRPATASLVQDIATVAPSSLCITIDYGFAASDLYHPDRLCGTVTGYRQHQRIDDLLDSPGQTDITAHVDFSSVASAFTTAALPPSLFVPQSTYFTKLARPLLLEMEDSGKIDTSLVRQLQTLTHPGLLGRSFSVLECRSAHLSDKAPLQQSDTLQRLGL